MSIVELGTPSEKPKRQDTEIWTARVIDRRQVGAAFLLWVVNHGCGLLPKS